MMSKDISEQEKECTIESAMDAIDRQIEATRDLIFDLQEILSKLEKKSNSLYEEKLNMIVAGYKESIINNYLMREWENFIFSLLKSYNEEEVI